LLRADRFSSDRFNVALQDESKDRKYRFVVKRLMKANQRQGDEIDEELDYYRTPCRPCVHVSPCLHCVAFEHLSIASERLILSSGDDDDVAVLFTMPDGSKAFVIGNIEEVAVASGTVDARRALSGTGAEYLRSLDKNYRKDGVWIDDPKGLFIFRWYREVKADGSPVTGPKRYQNPQTAAYQLTLDNDGSPFEWTSNIQIISKVYLTKHHSLPRTYLLNKKDGKMVKQGMAKMVQPET
jgi:hypothetical protein